MPTKIGRACGTYSAYAGGCRCDDCGGAKLRYQRDLRARRAPLNHVFRPRRTKYAAPRAPQPTIELLKARLGR